MSRNKVFLFLQSLICVIIAVMLIAGAIGIYREGIAARGVDPRADIYTVDGIKNALEPVLPVLVCGLVINAAAWGLGVRAESCGRTVYDIGTGRPLEADPFRVRPHKRLRMILLAIAVFFIIAGICNGSMRDVLNKAVRICSECIGLG